MNHLITAYYLHLCNEYANINEDQLLKCNALHFNPTILMHSTYLTLGCLISMHFEQVLDEADRLLNEDFEESLNEILGVIPRERRTFLFSATMTKKVCA